MKAAGRYAVAAIGTVLVLAASYGLGRAGEPQSHWLWCVVMKACR
jgi:hypothetical protein